jgi:hypothetical protein
MRDEDGHQAMLAAGKEWRAVKTAVKKMWSRWTTVIGPALVKARAEAMAIAFTNKPSGKGYNVAMSGLLQEYKLDDMEAVARNDMIAIMEHLNSVEAWHAKQRNRERLNHPTTVWRHFKNSDEYKADMMARGNTPPEDHSSLKTLDQKHFAAKDFAEGDLATAHERIAELESELDAARVTSIDRSVDAASRLPDPPDISVFGDEAVQGLREELAAARARIEELEARIEELEEALATERAKLTQSTRA